MSFEERAALFWMWPRLFQSIWGSVTTNVAANDTDKNNNINPASIIITSGPTNGSVVVNSDGTVTYTHDGSDTTSDSYSYTISDNTQKTSQPATVSISVTPIIIDFDWDGIFDNIDIEPTKFSNDFSDGTTSGTITLGTHTFLEITDNPGNGVNISSSVMGTVDVCGISSLSLSADSSINISCGSVTIEVVSGSVDVEFVRDDGTTVTTTLTEGDDVTFEQDAMVFTNNGLTPVIIEVNGEQTTIEEQTTIVVSTTYEEPPTEEPPVEPPTEEPPVEPPTEEPPVEPPTEDESLFAVGLNFVFFSSFFTLNPSDAASSIFCSFGLISSVINPNSFGVPSCSGATSKNSDSTGAGVASDFLLFS